MLRSLVGSEMCIRDSNNTYSTSSEKIVASVGIEEVRHVYYCSSFDYEAHYNGDGGRRRRQFYEGYHKQRYPHGTVPRAPPAVLSVKPPTHSIPCHSWSHEEAIANLHRKQSASHTNGCLLYTSDAADEEDSVDLGGRRIIKKKNKKDR
eukprot:TRINITY_DN10933_c0_g1_i1.p1 TRINITY_DN10933_c0_g1~~TRINITY_DN10933_c0_g1_i1.p1  ORF type:complete len:171 (-),score=50.36 TRINITY_DN10933_c0_g1_i1:14-460(-)